MVSDPADGSTDDIAERRIFTTTPAAAASSTAPESAPHTTAASRRPQGSSDDRWFWVAIGVAVGLAVALALWALWPTDSSGSAEDGPGATNDPAVQADVPIPTVPPAVEGTAPGDTGTDSATAAGAGAFAQTAPVSGAAAFERIEPSLVVVRAVRNGRPADASTITSGSNLGGGVVIDDQGHILTANHVVADADSIEVVYADGTTTTAQRVGSSPSIDIALLRPDTLPDSIVPAPLGRSADLRIGDPIFTIGNPLGLTNTLSSGIVSGLDRNIPFPGEGDLVLRNLIQFDAAVNQGSSGGPLIDAQGRVVGVITSLADPAGQGFFVGIGFAVPIDIAASGLTAAPTE